VPELEAAGDVLRLDREHPSGTDHYVIDVASARIDAVVDAVSIVERLQDLSDRLLSPGSLPVRQRIEQPARIDLPPQDCDEGKADE